MARVRSRSGRGRNRPDVPVGRSYRPREIPRTPDRPSARNLAAWAKELLARARNAEYAEELRAEQYEAERRRAQELLAERERRQEAAQRRAEAAREARREALEQARETGEEREVRRYDELVDEELELARWQEENRDRLDWAEEFMEREREAEEAWREEQDNPRTDKWKDRNEALDLGISPNAIEENELSNTERRALLNPRDERYTPEMQWNIIRAQLEVRSQNETPGRPPRIPTAARSVFRADSNVPSYLLPVSIDPETDEVIRERVVLGEEGASEENLYEASQFGFAVRDPEVEIRYDNIESLLRASNPFQYDDMRQYLAWAESTDYRDREGNTHDPLTGRKYNLSDYLLSENINIDVDPNTLKLLWERERKRERIGIAPGPQGFGGGLAFTGKTYDASKYVTAPEMLSEIHSWQKNDPERLKRWQQRLFDANILDEGYVPGVFDPLSIEATIDFFNYAQTAGQERDADFATLLDELSTARERSEGGFGGGGGGGGGFGGVPVPTSDPAALRAIADQVGVEILGRRLNEDERGRVVNALIAAEQNEANFRQTAEGGTFFTVDPQARAAEIIREMAPEEAGSHDIAGAFDQFADIISEGMGIGSNPGFGGTVTPQGSAGLGGGPSVT